ncbi:MAG: alpha-L-fucosidase [Bryobacteraceae bacterium]|jgi:alpha-L-fucosidase
MNRRAFHRTILGAAAGVIGRNLLAGESASFQPNWDSLGAHRVPDWYAGAKLGIFIHWGLYSVPAWAPTSGELGKVPMSRWFTDNAYAEWYLNSLRITGSPTWKHHMETYGKDFDYYDFMPMFNKGVEHWDPSILAKLLHRVGARYVVLTTKHHDGFTLWPSQVQNPKRAGKLCASRDLVGDLASAVRSEGMKMGLYYSGGLDWTFTTEPIRNVADLKARVPQSQEYATYADAHWRELIEHYQPSVMWNDINYPKLGQIPQLFAEYYNTVPDGVIDNRFGVPFCDFTTPEYSSYSKVTEKKWEACRGLGYSFGYNQAEGPEQVIAPDKLIALLVDIVSKNGNLLLNIGPMADGSISDIQMDRLHKLGDWLAVNGEGIFDSRPWTRAASTTGSGPDVRFTQKDGALYAYLLSPRVGEEIALPGIAAADGTAVRVLGAAADSTWKQDGGSLIVNVGRIERGPYAVGMRITPTPRPI